MDGIVFCAAPERQTLGLRELENIEEHAMDDGAGLEAAFGLDADPEFDLNPACRDAADVHFWVFVEYRVGRNPLRDCVGEGLQLFGRGAGGHKKGR
jgi:hypothetical protein